MVNGTHIDIVPLFSPIPHANIHPFTHTHTHTHIHTLMAEAAMQGANSAHQEEFLMLIHTHSYTDGTAFGSNLGFSILLDTLTSGLVELRTELKLLNDPLCHEPPMPQIDC